MNDLISRNALIEVVEEEINKGGIDGIVLFGMKKVLEYIYNAPTVEPTYMHSVRGDEK